MKLRYINLQLDRSVYDLHNVSEFSYRARFMCNYLSRKVRLLHFETDGTFKMISIDLGGTSIIDIVPFDVLKVCLPFNKEEYDKLDVKNILVLQNWLERIRKEVTNKVLSIKRISDFLNFPILAQPTLKKI